MDIVEHLSPEQLETLLQARNMIYQDEVRIMREEILPKIKALTEGKELTWEIALEVDAILKWNRLSQGSMKLKMGVAFDSKTKKLYIVGETTTDHILWNLLATIAMQEPIAEKNTENH